MRRNQIFGIVLHLRKIVFTCPIVAFPFVWLLLFLVFKDQFGGCMYRHIFFQDTVVLSLDISAKYGQPNHIDQLV